MWIAVLIFILTGIFLVADAAMLILYRIRYKMHVKDLIMHVFVYSLVGMSNFFVVGKSREDRLKGWLGFIIEMVSCILGFLCIMALLSAVAYVHEDVLRFS